jgi:hypothetical protein
MKTQKLDSFLKRIPSVVLALLTLVVATFVMFFVGESIEQFDRESYIAYSLDGLIIAAGCYYIIKNKPKSLWYVLPITNAMTIISAFVEPNFWRGHMWIPICGGWVVTIIAVLVASRIGRREIPQTKT